MFLTYFKLILTIQSWYVGLQLVSVYMFLQSELLVIWNKLLKRKMFMDRKSLNTFLAICGCGIARIAGITLSSYPFPLNDWICWKPRSEMIFFREKNYFRSLTILNALTDPHKARYVYHHKARYVYHAFWGHLSGLLHKSLTSVIPSLQNLLRQ
jgi:hypothetical protein